jgi:hypothetical protein
MTYVLWQESPGDRRTATVRGAGPLGLPESVSIVAAVSDPEDLRGQAFYIQLAVPGVLLSLGSASRVAGKVTGTSSTRPPGPRGRGARSRASRLDQPRCAS